MSENKDSFESYAIVELFGHKVIAGYVSEQTIGSQTYVRVDVAATGNQPAFTKLYGPGAIYCITPCDEATAKRAAYYYQQRPVEVLSLMAASRPSDFDDEG